MEKIKSVQYNFIMNFILVASNFIFPLITFPYVSRVLMASGNGKIEFVASIINYFGMLASLGIPTYGIKACAQIRDDKEKLSKTVQELILIHGIMTCITLIFFLISLFTIDKFYQEKELMLIYCISLILNVFGVNWLYSALEQYQYITIRSICFKIISLFLMFALVHNQSDYIIYGAILVLASAGSNVLNFINLKKYVHFKKYTDYNLYKHIKPILVFFAQSVAITIYTNLDTVMLGFMTNTIEVGLYSASVKVKSILNSLVNSLGTVLMPRLSYYANTNRIKEFKLLVSKSFNIVLLLSVSLTCFFVIMAKPSILLLSGEGYLGAIEPMQIIVPTIIFMGLSNVTGIQVLTPLNKENYVLVSVILGAIVNLISNSVFIPIMGASGAALGTLIAEGVVLIVQWIILKKIEKISFSKLNTIKIILSNLVPSVVLIIYFINISAGNVFFTLFIGAIVYYGIELFLLVLFKESSTLELIKIILNKLN